MRWGCLKEKQEGMEGINEGEGRVLVDGSWRDGVIEQKFHE